MTRVGIYLKSGFGNLGFGTGALPVLIKCLDDYKISIGKIIGCSAGSFAVPAAAIRKFNNLLNAWLNISPPDISKLHRWQTIRHPFRRPSLLDSSPLKKYTSTFIEPDLDLICSSRAIPFEIITTDIKTGHGVYFLNTPENKNILLDVCMASAGIVPFFAPRMVGDLVLIDGAFTDDLPITRFATDGCDVVFVIDLYDGIPLFNKEFARLNWPDALLRSMHISIAQHSRLRLDFGKLINNILEVFEKVDFSEETKRKLGIEGYSKCKIVPVTAEIPIDHVGFRDFDDCIKQQLLEAGYWAAKTTMKKMGLDSDNI